MPINDDRFLGEVDPTAHLNDDRSPYVRRAPTPDVGDTDYTSALKGTAKDLAMLPLEAADFLGGLVAGMTAWMASQAAGKGTAGAALAAEEREFVPVTGVRPEDFPATVKVGVPGMTSEAARALGESVEKSVAEALTYHPQTERGQAGLDLVGRAIDWTIGRGAHKVDHELSKIDPVLGYIYGLVVELSAFHAFGKGMKGAKPKIQKALRKMNDTVVEIKRTKSVEPALDPDIVSTLKEAGMKKPAEELKEWQSKTDAKFEADFKRWEAREKGYKTYAGMPVEKLPREMREVFEDVVHRHGEVRNLEIGSGELPKSGVAVYLVDKQGRIHYGKPGDSHPTLANRIGMNDLSADPGEGFVDPRGRLLSREDAYKFVKSEEPEVFREMVEISEDSGLVDVYGDGMLEAYSYTEAKGKPTSEVAKSVERDVEAGFQDVEKPKGDVIDIHRKAQREHKELGEENLRRFLEGDEFVPDIPFSKILILDGLEESGPTSLKELSRGWPNRLEELKQSLAELEKEGKVYVDKPDIGDPTISLTKKAAKVTPEETDMILEGMRKGEKVTHGTDIDVLEGILSEGLRPGSAVDTKGGWSEGYPVQVYLSDVELGKYVRHNKYYQSASSGKIDKVVVDLSHYQHRAVDKFKKQLDEIQSRHPDVKFEIRNDPGPYEPRYTVEGLTGMYDELTRLYDEAGKNPEVTELRDTISAMEDRYRVKEGPLKGAIKDMPNDIQRIRADMEKRIKQIERTEKSRIRKLEREIKDAEGDMEFREAAGEFEEGMREVEETAPKKVGEGGYAPPKISNAEKNYGILFISERELEGGGKEYRWYDPETNKRFTTENLQMKKQVETLRKPPKEYPKPEEIEALLEDIGVRATEGEDLVKLEEEAVGVMRMAEPGSESYTRAQDFRSIIRKMRKREAPPEKVKRPVEPLEHKIGEEKLTDKEAAARAGEELYEFSEESADIDIGRSASEVAKDLTEVFEAVEIGEPGGKGIKGETGGVSIRLKELTSKQRAAVERLVEDARKAGRSVREMLKTAGLDENTITNIERLAKELENLPVEEKMRNEIKDLDAANKFMSKVDVEAPFKASGAPETGFHVKNFYSTIDKYEGEGLEIVKDITKMNPRNMYEPAILAQKKSIPGSDSVSTAARKARAYFRSSFDRLEKLGVLQQPFPEEMINRRRAEIRDLQTRMEKNLGDKKGNKKILKQIQSKREDIETLKKMEFVHIPTALWFDRMAQSDPVKFKKVMNYVTAKKRRTISLEELIEKDLIKPEDIDIRDIIANYARRKGKDIAVAKIINAARKEGLVSAKYKKGFERIPSRHFPMLKQHWAAPYFLEYLKDFIGFYNVKPGVIHNILSVSKGFQFFNPLFLPFYDAYQAVMLGSLRSYKTPKYIYRAIKSTIKKDSNYWRSLEEGLSSKPFSNPWNTYWDMVEAAKHNWGGRIAAAALRKKNMIIDSPLKATVKVPYDLLKDVYGLSWNSAWYLDRLTRSMSYEFLIDKGYTPREAAQTAALYHADYASVPPRLRRQLNHIFFTPTFKIAMTKMYADMVSGAVKTANVLDMKKIDGKWVPPSRRARLAAKALLAAFAVNAGFDLLMKSQDFEREDALDWGVRYYKTVDTDEGPRELVLTISHPANLVNKYVGRLIKAAKPGGDPFALRAIKSFKWEVNPVWRILAFDLTFNQRPDGTPIYREGERDIKKALSVLSYAAGQIVRMTAMVHPSESDEKALNAAKKEFGSVSAQLLRPFTGRYLRRIGAERASYRIDDLKKKIQRDARDDKLTPEMLKNYQEKINELRDEIK